MRTQLHVFLLTMLSFQIGYSQITITSTDLPIIGDVIITHADTMAGVDTSSGGLGYTPGFGGANQIWDYSLLFNGDTTTSSFYAPSATPYAANFPGSNLAMTTNGNVYVYMSSSASIVTLDGLAGTLINPGDTIDYNPTQTMYQLPLTYGNNYSDNYAYDFQTSGAAFGLYKIRATSSGTIIDTVDGYGTLITPMGTYNSLRVKRWTNSIDSVMYKVMSDAEPWTVLSGGTTSTLSYSWLANGGKLPIIEMATDTGGNTTTMTYSEIPGTFGIEQTKQPIVLVGPNPFTEYISLTIPEEFSSGDIIIQLIDINGKIVMSKILSYNNQLTLDLSFLESGIYVFTISSNNYSSSGKIVKR